MNSLPKDFTRLNIQNNLKFLSKNMLFDLTKKRQIKESSEKLDRTSLLDLILKDIEKFPDKPLEVSNNVKPKSLRFEGGKTYHLKNPGMSAFKFDVLDTNTKILKSYIDWDNNIGIPLSLDLRYLGPELYWGLTYRTDDINLGEDVVLTTDYNNIICEHCELKKNSKIVGKGNHGLYLRCNSINGESGSEITTTVYFWNRIENEQELESGVDLFSPSRPIIRSGDHGRRGSDGKPSRVPPPFTFPYDTIMMTDLLLCNVDAISGEDAIQAVDIIQHGKNGGTGKKGPNSKNLTIKTSRIDGPVTFSTVAGNGGTGGRGGNGGPGTQGGIGGFMCDECSEESKPREGRKPGKGGKGGPYGNGGNGGNGGEGGDAGSITIDIPEISEPEIWKANAKGGDPGRGGRGGRSRLRGREKENGGEPGYWLRPLFDLSNLPEVISEILTDLENVDETLHNVSTYFDVYPVDEDDYAELKGEDGDKREFGKRGREGATKGRNGMIKINGKIVTPLPFWLNYSYDSKDYTYPTT